MPKREEILRCFIQREFNVDVHHSLKKPTQEEFYTSEFDKDLQSLFKNLGGLLEKYPTGFRGFDIRLKNKIIELDEEQHFNRYRLATLDFSIYTEFQENYIKGYKQYCIEKEGECLKKTNKIKYWTTESSEKQFGKSDEFKKFINNVSARWKQRAFYDVLRDVTPSIKGYKVIKISIYDTVNILDKELIVADILDDILNRDYQKCFKEYLEEVIGMPSSPK